MRAVLIVVLTPFFDDSPGVREGEEPVLVETLVTLPRFSGHLDCGEILAQEGVQDGHTIPGRVPPAGGGVSAAA